jgi:hypothetical protein
LTWSGRDWVKKEHKVKHMAAFTENPTSADFYILCPMSERDNPGIDRIVHGKGFRAVSQEIF